MGELVVNEKVSICWLRRDLRLEDNTALYEACKGSEKVLVVFVFDSLILSKLSQREDRRVAFIHETLVKINNQLIKYNSSLLVLHGEPLLVFEKLSKHFDIQSIFTNHDYEPYARKRDESVKQFAKANRINFYSYKDQVVFEKSEVMKKDNTPYTVFTPYSKIWKEKYEVEAKHVEELKPSFSSLFSIQNQKIPSLNELGFDEIESGVPSCNIDTTILENYHDTRNYPWLDGTSNLGVFLRFGTISVRKLTKLAYQLSETFLNELIWREFFMMILYHYPEVEHNAFKKKYDGIIWRNNEEEFSAWCNGNTGYPLVDAGMRQLNETGWMHNRVRMVVASFLTKHLLIDWRWGEAYFAEKLLDYELSSNNGNWQWAAGCGCDAAPYFRVFNPTLQAQKFDSKKEYIKRWISNYSEDYVPRIVDHDFARKRALSVYKKAL